MTANAAKAAPDYASARLEIAGSEAIADASGALWLPDHQTLVVADLHLEKSSAMATRGHLVPPYDTVETLDQLTRAVHRLAPKMVVALGDSLQDCEAGDRLRPQARARIGALQKGRSWIWIRGNHDPDIPPELGGEAAEAVTLGPLALQHHPGDGATMGEIAGHLHPAAHIVRFGYSIRRRCFIHDGRRLIMPAFGTYTGGLNVLAEAVRRCFPHGGDRVHMLGDRGVYPVARTQLRY